MVSRAWNIDHFLEFLLSIHESLQSVHSVLLNICNSRTWKAEGSDMKDHSWLHSEFKANLLYWRSSHKQARKQTNRQAETKYD